MIRLGSKMRGRDEGVAKTGERSARQASSSYCCSGLRRSGGADRPIEINLNINIRQEVVVRLRTMLTADPGNPGILMHRRMKMMIAPPLARPPSPAARPSRLRTRPSRPNCGRRSGGEQADGYLGLVTSAPSSVAPRSTRSISSGALIPACRPPQRDDRGSRCGDACEIFAGAVARAIYRLVDGVGAAAMAMNRCPAVIAVMMRRPYERAVECGR